MRGLSGFLLASTLGAPIERDHLLCPEPHRPNGPTLTFVSQPYRLRQWDELELTSPISLEDDGERTVDGPGPYIYRLYAIRGFSKVILLAERKRVVEYVINQILDRTVAPRLRKVALRLDDAVKYCESADSPYLITALLGRFAGPARQLRAIALYGDDITDTALFREHGHFFNFHLCGLGHRLKDGLPSVDTSSDREILRIGNDGFVLAHLGSRTKAREFLSAIGFIVSHQWMEDWVPVINSEPGAFG